MMWVHLILCIIACLWISINSYIPISYPSIKSCHLYPKKLKSSSITSCHYARFGNNDISSVASYVPTQLSFLDTIDIVDIAYKEFEPQCEGNSWKQFNLFMDILAVYIPKLFLPVSVMGHMIYGFKTSDKVIAMADVSLQTASGSMEALDRTSLSYRRRKYPELVPYISNFLVVKPYRRQGLGKRLISFIEDIAVKDGYNELTLHVDSTSLPAISFYVSLGYEPVMKLSNNIVFMKKVIKI